MAVSIKDCMNNCFIIRKHAESGSSVCARRTVLLCRLSEDGCKEGLLICPRGGDGSDPVGPIWRFTDRVRVGDQRLTFITLEGMIRKGIGKKVQLMTF